jgi:hypothetical protein
MKPLLYSFFVIAVLTAISCKKLDNYDAPNATLTGRVVDVNNKNMLIQTETGGGGTRIRLDELSWSDNPTPFYFNAIQDGSFNNTKLFPGTNRISVEGAFVPLVQYDASGNITVDKRQTIELKAGVTEIEFQVEPLLRVQYAAEPVWNADSTITIKVIVTRGTANPAFQSNVSDIFFYLNTVPNVGNNNYDNRYSSQLTYSGTTGNDMLGQTLTLTTNGKLPAKRSYWLRAGARTTYGLKQYNYTEIKTIAVP